MKDLIERLRNGLAITHRTRHKAADALEQAQQRIAELETKYECDCKEVHAARIYLRDQERLLREKAALALQVAQMREAWKRNGHAPGCRKNAFGDLCTCGLDAALTLSTHAAADLIAAHDAKVIERVIKAMPVTPYNVGCYCMSEDECIEHSTKFGSYERGVSDAANAFAKNYDAIRALIAAPKQGETKEVNDGSQIQHVGITKRTPAEGDARFGNHLRKGNPPHDCRSVVVH